MERTRSAAVLTTLGALALALATLTASPAGAEESEELVPFGRCDVYRPSGGEVVTGIERCVTGMVSAGATVEPPAPACPDAVPVHADEGVEFYLGECAEPAQTHETGGGATVEPAPAPTTTTTTAPPAAAAVVRSRPQAAPTTTVAPSTTSTTFAVAPPPEPSGGATVTRAGAAEVVTDPAQSITLTSAGSAAEVETDHSPLVMLFALALAALVLLGISRIRTESTDTAHQRSRPADS